MSWQAVHAVLRAEIKPPARKLVAVGLAAHSDKDGRRAFPGEERLTWYAALRARQVYEHLEALIADGVIRQTASGHNGQRAEFDLDMDRLAELGKGAPERRLNQGSRVRSGASSLRSGALKPAVERTPKGPEPSERSLGRDGETKDHVDLSDVLDGLTWQEKAKQLRKEET